MRAFITQDGTVLVFDPHEGVVSGRSREEAEAEIRRRKLARQQKARVPRMNALPGAVRTHPP